MLQYRLDIACSLVNRTPTYELRCHQIEDPIPIGGECYSLRFLLRTFLLDCNRDFDFVVSPGDQLLAIVNLQFPDPFLRFLIRNCSINVISSCKVFLLCLCVLGVFSPQTAYSAPIGPVYLLPNFVGWEFQNFEWGDYQAGTLALDGVQRDKRARGGILYFGHLSYGGKIEPPLGLLRKTCNKD